METTNEYRLLRNWIAQNRLEILHRIDCTDPAFDLCDDDIAEWVYCSDELYAWACEDDAVPLSSL